MGNKMKLRKDMGCLAISILVIVAALVTAGVIIAAFNYVYGGAPWNFY